MKPEFAYKITAMRKSIWKFFLLFPLVVFIATLVSSHATAQDDWEQIKDHGPHAGLVKMSADHSIGIEIIPQQATPSGSAAYDVYPLAGNFGPLTAEDIKITIRQKDATKNKDEPCQPKEYYFSCILPSMQNEGELFFSIFSKSLKVENVFVFELPLNK